MSEPRQKRAVTRRAVKCALAFFGVLLGGAMAVFVLELPDSAPWTRVQALWQPAFGDLRRGSAALKQGQTAAAAVFFDHAIASSDNGGNAQTVLDLAVDTCGRHQAWDLAVKYAALSLQRRHSTVDELRYAEALAGARKTSVASYWLQQVLQVSPGPRADNQTLLVHELAEKDLASLLADNADSAADLNRARQLAEDGINSEIKRGESTEVMASLNDALGWVYFKLGVVDKNPGEMEMARIYAENAVDALTSSTDPTVAATVYYHLSEIYSAEGRKPEAIAAYKSAWKLSGKTVRWQLAEADRAGPKASVTPSNAQPG